MVDIILNMELMQLGKCHIWLIFVWHCIPLIKAVKARRWLRNPCVAQHRVKEKLIGSSHSLGCLKVIRYDSGY